MSNPSIVKVTSANFATVVREAQTPVLVDFWAEWCGPCRKLAPVLDKVAEELGDKALVAKVNIDEQRELAALFQIMSIPTVLVFNKGEVVDQLVGVKPAAAYVAAVSDLA